MTFTVNTADLDNLSASLDALAVSTGHGRACSGQGDAAHYNQTYIRMETIDPGFLFFLAYRQTEALRETLSGTIQRIGTALMGSASEVSRSNAVYSSLDAEARERLDASYPGAVPGSVEIDLPVICYGPPNLSLPTPTSSMGSDYVAKILTTDWLSPSDIVATLIDLVFDWNPWDEVARVFTGDWDRSSEIASALAHLSSYSANLGQGAGAAAQACLVTWNGEAADAAAEWFNHFLKVGHELEKDFRDLSTHYGALAQSMASLGELAAGLTAQIMDALIYAALCAAAGTATSETVVGGIVFGALAVYEALKAASMIKLLYKTIQDAANYLNAFVAAVTAIAAMVTPAGMSVSIPAPYDNQVVS